MCTDRLRRRLFTSIFDFCRTIICCADARVPPSYSRNLHAPLGDTERGFFQRLAIGRSRLLELLRPALALHEPKERIAEIVCVAAH
jgi:hypothetical protein